MTREEAMEIVKLYKSWNVSQKSASLAFGGPRTDEDDVLDARRKALAKALEILAN